MATKTTNNAKMTEEQKIVRNENAKKEMKKAFADTHVYFTDKQGSKFSVTAKFDRTNNCVILTGSNLSGDSIAILTELENGHIFVSVAPRAIKGSRIYSHKKELCSRTKNYLESTLNHYSQFVMFDDLVKILEDKDCKGVKIVGEKYKKVKLEEVSVGHFEKREVEYTCELTKAENESVIYAKNRTKAENKRREIKVA